ncbi:MAG: hypothetical protein CMH52_04615 [Myxococcales bacterium]|nr:hypothetical protein [Myxococcales bacterium]|tara:strand:- start:64 stop:801 length:738 start_codon:yes stop_codon:yes gene_type:complete
MKCPNCASDVPDSSNFCGVCGFDVRPARAAAANLNQTVALEQPSNPVQTEPAPKDNGATMHDSAPEPVRQPKDSVAASAAQKKAPPETMQTPEEQPSKEYAPSPEIQSTSFDLKVSSMPAKGDSSQPASPIEETFASMPALEPPAPGKFRETQWFMAAQDPDHIDNIGNVVLDDLEENYKPEDGTLDSQIREKFSLNVPNSQGTNGNRAALSPGDSRGPDKKVIIIVGAVALAAIVGYFVLSGSP